ncbi:MAG: hypothetical protein U0703_20105 [Anaerolineae bacterium]
MASNVERFLRRHGYFLIALLLLGVAAYNLSLSIYPLDLDNLLALDIGANRSIFSMFRGSSVQGLPFYRPIPYITVIIEYQIFGLNTPLISCSIWGYGSPARGAYICSSSI